MSNDPNKNHAVETADRLFREGLYCAEAVLMATSEELEIKSDLVPSIATGFCSGISRTSGMCGALTGAILSVNLVHGRKKASDDLERNYAIVQELVEAFAERCGSINCTELLDADLGTPEGQLKFENRNLGRKCLVYTRTATELAVQLLEGTFPSKDRGKDRGKDGG